MSDQRPRHAEGKHDRHVGEMDPGREGSIRKRVVEVLLGIRIASAHQRIGSLFDDDHFGLCVVPRGTRSALERLGRDRYGGRQ
jgi:hypothetical protein